MLDWLTKNQMNVFGLLCIMAAILNTGTTGAVYYVGALLCWGIQLILEVGTTGDKDE